MFLTAANASEYFITNSSRSLSSRRSASPFSGNAFSISAASCRLSRRITSTVSAAEFSPPTQKQPASVSKISPLAFFFFFFLLQMTLRLFEFVRRSFRVTRVKGEGGFCRLILLRFKEHSVIVEFPLHVFGVGV